MTSSGDGIFAGMKWAFVASSDKQLKITAAYASKHGAEVLNKSCKSLIDPSDITHILLDNSKASFKAIKAVIKLADAIPKSIKVVDARWLHDSATKGCRLDESSYLVTVNTTSGGGSLAAFGFTSASMTAAAAKQKREDEYRDHNFEKTFNRLDGKDYTTAKFPSSMLQTLPDISTVEADTWNMMGTFMLKYSSAKLTPTKANSTPIRCVGFDLDWTVIKTKSGNVFPKFPTANDWVFFSPSVPTIIRRIASRGYRVVIVSNQNKLVEPARVKDWQDKVDAVIAALDVPVDVICSLNDDLFRKPRTGKWEVLRAVLQQHYSNKQGATTMTSRGTNARNDKTGDHDDSVDKLAGTKRKAGSLDELPNDTQSASLAVGSTHPVMSLFIGDAAGRPAVTPGDGVATFKRTADFADSDLTFALNVCAEFQTPDVFFLGAEEKLHSSEGGFVKPRGNRLCDLILPTKGAKETETDTASELETVEHVLDCENTKEKSFLNPSGPIEIVLLCATPINGKSTLARRIQNSLCYTRVNQDHLGTFDNCLKVAREAIEGVKSKSGSEAKGGVVIDNCNHSVATRKKWIVFAKEMGVPVRCIRLTANGAMLSALKKFRALDPCTLDEDKRSVPDFVRAKILNEMVEPHVDEGFERVDSIRVPLELPSHPVSRALFESYI